MCKAELWDGKPGASDTKENKFVGQFNVLNMK